jgi:cell division protein FtsI/penicillin-binding protein 2
MQDMGIRQPRPKPGPLALAAVAIVVLTAACGGGDKPAGPDPADAAKAFATALVQDDFSTVAFDGSTPDAVTQEYDGIVAGLNGVTPTVAVGDVSTTSDTAATAKLDWSWPLGTGWNYDTTVPLTLVAGKWQVTWSPAVVETSLVDADVLDATTVSAKRGNILGAGGVGLVVPRPVVRFGVDRTKVGETTAVDSARRLAQLIGIDVASYVKQVKASGPKAFIEAIVYRQEQVPPAVTNGYTQIKGVDALAGDLPLGITKGFAAPILGTVGPVTAEMIKKDPEAYRVGDEAGLSGLEARYDEQLRGTPGVEVDAVASDDKRTKLFKVSAVNGTALKLTLDDSLQALAESILAHVKPASAIVAIRPSTGAILAAANGPGNNGYNDATYGRFAPGSTFKTAATLALLKKGVTPSSTVSCPTAVSVNGKEFTNDSFYPPSANGSITLASALANSCNTAYINERTKLGSSDLVDAAATLGMGVDHDLGFPAYFGNVVPPASETEKAADMIGQGQDLASPMTMATVMASVVAGHTVVPQLIKSVTPDATSPEPLTAAEDATLKSMLRGVVTGGTGLGLKDVPGSPVIAKTGTAEFDRNGKRFTHAWMIAGQGDLAVCAFVDVGPTGAGTAGPLLESFLRGALAR